MDERQVLVRIDHVSQAIKKAEPDQLGKAIRLLDAMKRLAVGKKWVAAIGSADAGCLKARRRAGEIVELAGAKDPKGTHKGKPRTDAPRGQMREEMGISKVESIAWQALARVPEAVFDEYVEKVETREEDGTVSGALDYARRAKRSEEGEPETHVREKKSYDKRRIDDLVNATDQWLEAAAFDRLDEIQDPKVLGVAIELIEKTIEYAQKQLERLRPVLKGAIQ